MDGSTKSIKGKEIAEVESFSMNDQRDLDIADALLELANNKGIKRMIKAANTLVEMANSGACRHPPEKITKIKNSKRFKRIKDQKKSRITIKRSSEQVIAHFHKEENKRYSNLQEPFSYMARDGKKSTVAPLIKSSDHKLAAKARNHALLRERRPSHFTVLSLVRDAASRLPGRSGTRGDICLLARDSQYLVENIPIYQLRRAVTGALDRLRRSERDPCVRFDRVNNLWVYLHGDRKYDEF